MDRETVEFLQGQISKLERAVEELRTQDVPIASRVYNILFAGARSGADSTAAVQETIDLAEARGGGVIYAPYGSYSITGQLRVKENSITFMGDGRNSSVLAFTSALGANAGIYCENDASATEQIKFLRFSDISLTLAHDDSVGVLIERGIEPVFDGVYITGNGGSGSGQTAIIMDGEGDQTGAGGTAWGGGLRLTHCRVSNCKNVLEVRNVAGASHLLSNWLVGIYPIVSGSKCIDLPLDGTGGNVILGNLIENFTTGIADDDVGNMYVGNRFENVTTPISQTSNCSRYYSANFMVDSCGASTYSGYGIALDGGGAGEVRTEIGGVHSAEPVFVVRGAYSAGGPRISLINNGASSTLPLIAMKGVGSTDTDDFGASGPAGQISVEATAPLRIGTGSSRDIEIYYNNTKSWIINSTAVEGVISSSQGIILKSPDGTRYIAKMANGGTWTISAA